MPTKPYLLKISQLEKTKRMGHDINQFHDAQLKEKGYMSMIRSVSKITSEKINHVPKNELNIIEIGAGSGILSLYLVNSIIKSIKKIKLIISEPDPGLLSFTINYISKKVKNKKRFQQLIKSKRVCFVELKAQDILKLKLKHADIIVSSELFHHLPYHKKTSCIVSFLKLVTPNGYIIAGDNFVADKYDYLDKNKKAITKRKIIAPKVAKLLKYFWTKLFKGKEWPESFKLAYKQQKEGFVECKTSLPHLICMISNTKGKRIYQKILTKKINQYGGYAVLVIN